VIASQDRTVSGKVLLARPLSFVTGAQVPLFEGFAPSRGMAGEYPWRVLRWRAQLLPPRLMNYGLT